jgi:hypothetical protein
MTIAGEPSHLDFAPTYLKAPNSGRLARVKPLDGLRARIVAGALFAAGWCTTPAHAAEISVNGPAACPDASELAFRVERSLGAPLAESAPLAFEVVFEAPAAPGASYTARLRAHRAAPGATSTRVIRARDCGRLGDAVGVAIALAVRSPEAAPSSATRADPGAASSAATSTGGSIVTAEAAGGHAPDPATSTPVTRTAADSAASTDRDQPPSHQAPADETPSPVLSAFFVADSGSLPSAGVGFGLSAELRTERLAFRAQGALLFEQHVAFASGAGAPGADMGLVWGSASACWSPFGGFRSSLAAFGCAGWELGRLAAEGTGVDAPRSGAQLWTAPRLDGGVSGALGSRWLRGTLQLSALAPLKRDDFFLRDAGSVHRPPAAVGRLTIGVDFSFE